MMGAGGRMSDKLKSISKSTGAYSFADNSIWPMGVNTSRKILSENGISRFEYFEEWRETTRALSQQRLGNAYAEEYTLALETSLTSTEGLSAALSSVSIKSTSWTLGGQLQGKTIHNKYPESVAPDNKQDQGREPHDPHVPLGEHNGLRCPMDGHYCNRRLARCVPKLCQLQ